MEQAMVMASLRKGLPHGLGRLSGAGAGGVEQPTHDAR